MGDKMKKGATLTLIVLSILLVGLLTVTSTYSIIVNVIENNGVMEIIEEVTVRDLLTNDNGSYNETYYMVKNELGLTEEEAETLMKSPQINDSLKIVLKSIVDYKINNNTEARLSNEKIYSLITDSVLKTNNISDDIKSRIINKASTYKNDISKYLYDIEVSLLGDNI